MVSVVPDPLQRVLDCLEGVEQRDGYFAALCPGHQDHDPSLEIKEVGENGSRKVRVRCWAGCETKKILDNVGLKWKDLFSSDSAKGSGRRIVATYDYISPTGELLHQTVRYEPKDFRQRRPNGSGGWVWSLTGVEPVLYRLPNVMRSVLAGEDIFILEGEKDCDRAREEFSITATTCPMGAGKWRDSYTHVLRGANIVFVPDNDEAGRGHVLKAAEKLDGVAKSVKVLGLPDLPEKGDLSGWIDAGGTRQELDRLVSKTPLFTLPAKESEFGEDELLPVKSLREIATEAEETPDWIVKNLLKKGELTDLSGLAKYSGKSTLIMHMLKAMRAGDLFLGDPTKQAQVLYLTEQGNNFKEVIENAGLNLDDSGFIVVQHRDVQDKAWVELIENAVKHCEKEHFDVLVVDTFAAFTKLTGSEENNSGDIRARMEPLKKAAQSHNLAVLVARHAGKDGKGRGSSQFEAEVDIVAALKRPEGNQAENVRQLETIGRYGATKLNIELTEHGYVPLGSDEKVAFSKAVQCIKGFLPRQKKNAVTEDALLEKAKGEVSKGSVIRALRWLVEKETVTREGAGKKGSPYAYWLPASDPEPPRDSFSPNPDPIDGEKEKAEKMQGGTESSSTYELVTNPIRLAEVAALLKGSAEASLDLETTGLSPIEDKVRMLSLHAGGSTFLIDCFAVSPVSVLKALKDKVLYIHGAEFDLPFLYHRYGLEPPENVLDTLHLSQLARAGEWQEKKDGGWERKRHSLKDALQRELGVTLGDKKKFQRGESWTGDLTDEHLEYAAGDVVYLKALADKLFGLIEGLGLEEVWKLECRAKRLFLAMCIRGIPLDKGRWESLIGELERKVVSLKQKADGIAPPHPEKETWNWNSPSQAKKAFSLVGLKVPDLQRETLSRYNDPLIKAVAEYRDAQSLLSRVRKWAAGRYRDGRVYPQWNPGGAATGRASCTSPNVQSLPKGPFRGCIRPPDGRVVVKADLSQIELRVLARITEDENMLEVFRKGGDIHLNTAEALAGRSVDKGDAERQKAKAVNFGLSFGMGAKRFKEMAERDYGVRMTLSEATEDKRKLLDAYPGVRRWHRKEAAERDRGNFETFTLLGRRRVVEPDYEGKPSFTERLNAPVQGTAADILKLALARLWESREEHPGALPILTVHDEIVIECDADDAQDVARWLSETLRGAVEKMLDCPELAGEDTVDTSVLSSWGRV